MIKLLHLADVHIGMENYGRLDPATGLSTRVQDFLDTLDEAVERAISDRVDLVAFAGDIYKTRDPSPTHQREFARRVVRLTREGIAVVLVAGNHDIPAARGRATSVDIFRVLDLSLVTVARRIELLRVETRSGPIQIVSLPWLTRSAFLAEDEYKNKSVEELLELMVDLADKRLADVTAGLDPSVPAALIGHSIGRTSTTSDWATSTSIRHSPLERPPSSTRAASIESTSAKRTSPRGSSWLRSSAAAATGSSCPSRRGPS